jgi:hypothetical protein
VDCTPVLVAGSRGYAFTGDGTFAGLLGGQHVAHYLWWNEIRTRVYKSATR